MEHEIGVIFMGVVVKHYFATRGVARFLQAKHLKGSNYYNCELFRYFRYEVFDVKLFILENVIPQITVADLSNTRVLLLVNKLYTTKNKCLLGIYAIVNQVNLRLKEMIHMFVTYGDLV